MKPPPSPGLTGQYWREKRDLVNVTLYSREGPARGFETSPEGKASSVKLITAFRIALPYASDTALQSLPSRLGRGRFETSPEGPKPPQPLYQTKTESMGSADNARLSKANFTSSFRLLYYSHA